MRLFLASERFGKFEKKFINMVGKNARVAYIMNAADMREENERLEYAETVGKEIYALGFTADEIDLRDFSPDTIKNELKKYTTIIVAGGNTFVLRYIMQKSGFDVAIKNALRLNEILYAGWSAGAMVAGPTIDGSQCMDDPELAEVQVLDGLKLIDYAIIPHCDSEKYGETAKEYETHLINKDIPYKMLNDDQVLIIDNLVVEVLK